MVAGMRLSLFAIRAAVARRGITPVACYAIAVPLWHFYFSVQLLFRVLENVQLSINIYIYCGLYDDDNRTNNISHQKNTNFSYSSFFLDVIMLDLVFWKIL